MPFSNVGACLHILACIGISSKSLLRNTQGYLSAWLEKLHEEENIKPVGFIEFRNQNSNYNKSTAFEGSTEEDDIEYIKTQKSYTTNETILVSKLKSQIVCCWSYIAFNVLDGVSAIRNCNCEIIVKFVQSINKIINRLETESQMFFKI